MFSHVLYVSFRGISKRRRCMLNISFDCKHIWKNFDFLNEGKPIRRKFNNRILTHSFNLLHNFISPTTNIQWVQRKWRTCLGKIPEWNTEVESLTTFLMSKGLTWHSVDQSETGPRHLGWSRLVLECQKAKKFCTLLKTKPLDHPRNSNEQAWLTAGLTNYKVDRCLAKYSPHA